MKRYEFTKELNERAMKVYSNSDFVFYKENDTFYGAIHKDEKPFELGTLEDVEEFLMEFAEDDEEEE